MRAATKQTLLKALVVALVAFVAYHYYVQHRAVHQLGGDDSVDANANARAGAKKRSKRFVIGIVVVLLSIAFIFALVEKDGLKVVGNFTYAEDSSILDNMKKWLKKKRSPLIQVAK